MNTSSEIQSGYYTPNRSNCGPREVKNIFGKCIPRKRSNAYKFLSVYFLIVGWVVWYYVPSEIGRLVSGIFISIALILYSVFYPTNIFSFIGLVTIFAGALLRIYMSGDFADLGMVLIISGSILFVLSPILRWLFND